VSSFVPRKTVLSLRERPPDDFRKVIEELEVKPDGRVEKREEAQRGPQPTGPMAISGNIHRRTA
jgi:hypothetical protein